MKYLFDSNTISDLFDTTSKQHSKIIEKLNAFDKTDSVAIVFSILLDIAIIYMIKKHNIDIMLASCAICENYCLVSADGIYQDLKQFADGLYVEDWTVL